MSKKKTPGPGPTRHHQGEDTESRVAAVLAADESTVDEVASAVGIGRTSARKHLAALQTSGKATRSPGGREGRRRLPDRYRAVGDVDTTRSAPANAATSAARLRPGALDPLVLGYMAEHPDNGPFGATAVAKGLGRSAGAVANCLARLVVGGRVISVGERPRRHVPADIPR
jgi:hypothetical protein